jgi:hypothetical protein
VRKKLGDILVTAGLIDERGLQAALAEQKRRGGPLGRALIELKLVSEEVLVVALSKQLNIPTVDLDKVNPSPETLERLTGEYAEHNSIVPLKVSGKFLDVAMTDPTNIGVLDELRIRSQMNIRPYIAGPKAMERALHRLYGRGVNPLARQGGEEQFFPDGMQMLDFDDKAPRAEATPVPAAMKPSLGAGPPRTGAQAAQAAPAPAPRPQLDPFAAAGKPSVNEAALRAEIETLQKRIVKLEALVARDEDVLRKFMALLVDKGIATREEILERLK